MAKDNIQDKLSRVRPPRVHIKYEVQVGGATVNQELPFVVGVLGDFGRSEKGLPKLIERQFMEVTPDNFDGKLKDVKPRLTLSVPNRLPNGTGDLKIDLSFEKLADFNPDEVAKRIPALKKLLDTRTKLADLRGSLQGNLELDELLKDVMDSTNQQQQLGRELESSPRKGDDHA